jgi:hypothetical protein
VAAPTIGQGALEPLDPGVRGQRAASLTPEEAALRGRIGALVLHSRRDPRETTAKARAAFLANFERQVDPEGVLAPEERRRRAEYARRAHFARLALKSARARAKGRGPTNGAASVDQTEAAAGGEVSGSDRAELLDR